MVKRGRTKDTLSVTIDKELLKRFNNHCDDNAINKSKLIEKLISDYSEGEMFKNEEIICLSLLILSFIYQI